MKKLLIAFCIGLLLLSGCSNSSPSNSVEQSQQPAELSSPSSEDQGNNNQSEEATNPESSKEPDTNLDLYKQNLQAAFDGYGIQYTLTWNESSPSMNVKISDLSEAEINNIAIAALYKDIKSPESFSENLNLTYSINDTQVKSYSVSRDGEITYALPTPLVINGSNAYDIVVNLENNGFSKHEISEIPNGYIFMGFSDSEMYRLETDDKYSIVESTFVTYYQSDSNGYLKYCATMPYEKADTQAAVDFISKNIGGESTITIGDAVFTLRPIAKGNELKIHAEGFDEYVNQCLDYQSQE